MRQLLPSPLDDVDAYDAAASETDGPLLRVNFVVSADGSVTDRDGHSAGLGGDGDHAMFRALRARADAILVAAGTARSEGYGPHRPPSDLAARRRADGRPDPAAVVVVTRSLDLDLGGALFTEAAVPTVVVTCAAAPRERRAATARAARLLVAGDDQVDLADALRRLRDDGLASVLCEGGPRLTADLLAAGLVDELCLTIAPTVVGGGPGLADGLAGRVDLALERLFEADGDLMARYRVPHSWSAADH